MITMQRISDEVPRTAPLLRVYRNYCTLNAAAMRLLGVGGYRTRYAEVAFSECDSTVWICGTDNAIDYKISAKSRLTGRINSVTLSKQLCKLLGGYGTYLINQDRRNYEVNSNKFYYAIQKQ